MPESYPSRWAEGKSEAVEELIAAILSAVYVLDGNGCHGTATRLAKAFEKAEGHFVPRAAVERFSSLEQDQRVN